MLKHKAINLPAVKESFFKSVLTRWLEALCFLVAVSFFLQTYDSARVKIVLFYAGSLGLAGLWFCSLIKERASLFTRRNFAVLLPFLLYFLYVCGSYFLQPYAAVRSESFFRFALYGLIFLVVFFEYDSELIYKLVSSVIFTSWFVYAYGILQIINDYLLPGADPLFWTDFFGKRVFSTLANPNFFGDFCLFTLILAAGRFLYTKHKSLLILMVVGLVNMFFTESKGAWAALAVSVVFFGFIYFNFFVDIYKKNKLKFNIAAAVVLICATLMVSSFALKRMQSVNFRLSTWRATLDMIETKPVVGTGIGSFGIIYPSYKRPEIFYMENLHNAETQHAEDYYLETWAELGLLGFGLFLFCGFYMLRGVFKKFKKFDGDKKELYTLLGCFCASAAIYIHNFVDVSIYFVSTGLFLTVFNAATLNIAFGKGQKKLAKTPEKEKRGGALFCAVCAALLFFVFAFIAAGDFDDMTRPVSDLMPVTYLVCWAFFIAVAFGAAGVMSWTVIKAKNIKISVILSLAAVLMYFSFGFLKSDYYLSLAGKLAEKNDIEAARYYAEVIKTQPFDAESYMHRGLLFSNRLSLTPSNNLFWGDEKNKLFDDYDRAARDFKASLKLAPSSVLIYYHIGSLQRNMAYKLSKMPEYSSMPEFKTRVQQLYADSRQNLMRALEYDPVYDNIYYQLANVAFDNADFKTAYFWILKYIKGPAGVVNPEYLARHRDDKNAAKYLEMAAARMSPEEIAQVRAEVL